MTPIPTVSIGVPVRNGERYLETALSSLLAQTYQDFEVIISDNASDDATLEICRRLAERDERIRVLVSPRNRGAAWNYNRVAQAARGRYFKWAAHDDICEPTFLERCVQTFESAPDSVVVVYPRAAFIDESGRVTALDTDSMETTSRFPVRRLSHAVATVNMANAVFGLIRTEALRATRLIDSFVASDYVLLVELSLLGQIREVPHVLQKRRQHARSSRAANRTLEEVAAWFDPTRAAAPRSVRRMLLREYARSAWRAPVSLGQRLACILAIPIVHYQRRARVRCGRARSRWSARVRRERDPLVGAGRGCEDT